MPTGLAARLLKEKDESMRRTHPRQRGTVAAQAVLAIILAAGTASADVAAVTLRPDVRYQTIMGWSAMPWYPGVSPEVRDQVLDEAVDDLGLTWVHWTVPSGNRSSGLSWELVNDDGDPLHVNWPAFGTGPVDRSIRTWVLPFKRRVEARGQRFGMAITQTFHNRGSTGIVPSWLLANPGEFAEYCTSLLLHLKNVHGLDVAYTVICKDAGDSDDNPFEAPVVAEMIKALGPRLAALGLPTKVLYPECHDADTCWRFIQAARDDEELWPFVGMVGYHLYGGEALNTDRPKIRQFALAKGLPTGHAGSDGISLAAPYDDLTLGGVSYWSIGGLGGPGGGGGNFQIHLNGTSFSRGAQYWQYRQVTHYVRPGAVRVDTASDSPAVRPLAFVHNGRTTVVLIRQPVAAQAPPAAGATPAQPLPVTIRNLPAGTYGLSRTTGAGPYEELGVRTVGPDGLLTVDVPVDCVLTAYPHQGGNLPPTVTAWEAQPNFLTRPGSGIRLSAAAVDPELNRLTYRWSVTRQPPGARATLADPQSAATPASGLTAAGRYAFTVEVGDGTNQVKRDVLLNVYEGNQPPMLLDVHNRLPVMVTLPQGETELRGGALDLEDDKVTFRWSVVRQPAGSDVRLETSGDAKCKVTGITKAGDHVFRLEASDGAGTVAADLTVPVFPVNSAPVIQSARAEPATLRLPDSMTTLSAMTSDPDGDVISHWWRIKKQPDGSKPVFSKQGASDTTVAGLTVAGAYVFELTVVDRTMFATREVTVTVAPKGPAARPAANR